MWSNNGWVSQICQFHIKPNVYNLRDEIVKEIQGKPTMCSNV